MINDLIPEEFYKEMRQFAKQFACEHSDRENFKLAKHFFLKGMEAMYIILKQEEQDNNQEP